FFPRLQLAANGVQAARAACFFQQLRLLPNRLQAAQRPQLPVLKEHRPQLRVLLEHRRELRRDFLAVLAGVDVLFRLSRFGWFRVALRLRLLGFFGYAFGLLNFGRLRHFGRSGGFLGFGRRGFNYGFHIPPLCCRLSRRESCLLEHLARRRRVLRRHVLVRDDLGGRLLRRLLLFLLLLEHLFMRLRVQLDVRHHAGVGAARFLTGGGIDPPDTLGKMRLVVIKVRVNRHAGEELWRCGRLERLTLGLRDLRLHDPLRVSRIRDRLCPFHLLNLGQLVVAPHYRFVYQPFNPDGIEQQRLIVRL